MQINSNAEKLLPDGHNNKDRLKTTCFGAGWPKGTVNSSTLSSRIANIAELLIQNHLSDWQIVMIEIPSRVLNVWCAAQPEISIM